jgi:hypothetical protein
MVAEQEAPQAISVDWPPRQIRTRPEPEPSLTTTWLWNTVRPMASIATTSVTPKPLPVMYRVLASTTVTSAMAGLPTMTDPAGPRNWTRWA